MYFEILDSKRLSLLQKICEINGLDSFYLAGGTALSFQIKLRKSFDFNFFTDKPFNENVLYESIKSFFPNNIDVITLNRGTCNLFVNGIQVSFFEYPYPIVNELVTDSQI